MKKLHRTRAVEGFTLTELAIVLGVIGAIFGAVWWAAGNAREAQKQNDALSELQNTVQNIVTLMAGHTFSSCGTYGTTLTSCMIQSQVIPSAFVDSNGITADTPWKQSAFVIYGAAQGNTQYFRVSFYNVTRGGCLALLLQATACQSNQSGCPLTVYTADATKSLTPNVYSAAPGAPPPGWEAVVTPTAADTLCSYNDYSGGGGANSVEFDFSL